MKEEIAPIGTVRVLLGNRAVGLNASWLTPRVKEGWWRVLRVAAQITASAAVANRFSALTLWSATNVQRLILDSTAAQTAGQDLSHLWIPGGVVASVGNYRQRGGWNELVLGAGENLTVQIVSGADAADTITAVVGVVMKIAHTSS